MVNEHITINLLSNLIAVLKNNEVYRISDVYKLSKFNSTSKHIICKEILNNQEYENSILKSFLVDIINPIYKNKLTTIYNNIKYYIDKNNINPIMDDTLVVYIRSGDNYLVNGLGNETIKEKLYDKINNEIKNNNLIKNIKICTALHYGHCDFPGLYSFKSNNSNSKLIKQFPDFYKLSNNIYFPIKYTYSHENHKKNILELYDFIINLPLPVTIQSSKDIDEDFVYLCSCKNFITLSNGFGKLVKDINTFYNKNN